MSNAKTVMSQAANTWTGPTYIEDVFSTYLYTGTGSAQTITNGIDLAGEGGLVWIKKRTGAASHFLFDTERGAGNRLQSDTTNPNDFSANSLTAFTSSGFSVNTVDQVNDAFGTFASWTFRKAPRFFDCVTWTGTGTPQNISHNLGVTPGCIMIKSTSISGNWWVWHRTLPDARYGLYLNGTSAQTTSNTTLDWTDPTDTVFRVGTSALTNTSGATYVAYLFAHDPLGPSEDGSDGLIACGSYTGNGSSNGPVVDLGWEPQWLLVKDASNANDWFIWDTMRGLPNRVANSSASLNPNKSDAEFKEYGTGPTPTGFEIQDNNAAINTSGSTYIYIAIRRGPMRQPESGTEVFQPSYGLNASNSEIVNAGFPIDLNWRENVTGGFNVFLQDRMRGFDNFLSSNTTSAEAGAGGSYSGTQNGILTSATLDFSNWINWSFRRAPGFFDVVAYTGGGTFTTPRAHNLTVSPELVIVKARTSTGQMNWYVGHYGLNVYATSLTTAAVNNTNLSTYAPVTESTFVPLLDASGTTYIAYLFATLPGVSKVGSYTGNGSSQTIDCGFTSGARFILIKRTDSTGDWYVWDTTRGIVAGNDPHLSLNTTAAEVTTDDTIDPDSSGFIVNQVSATNVNVSSATYIFLAIA